MNTIWNKIKKNKDQLNLIAVWCGIALTLCFSIISFCNSQSINKISRENLEQMFRPIGTIRHPGEYIVLNYIPNPEKQFSFCYSPFVVNTGNGVLKYLGNINYGSKYEFNFRKAFLNNKLQNIIVDKMHSYARSTSLQKNDSMFITLLFESDSFFTPVYLYSLAFYEDQNGNLYDTEPARF
jgi:hypothetical protein